MKIKVFILVLSMLLVATTASGILFAPGFKWQGHSTLALNPLASVTKRYQAMLRDHSTTFPLSITGKEINQIKVAIDTPKGFWIENAVDQLIRAMLLILSGGYLAFEPFATTIPATFWLMSPLLASLIYRPQRKSK